MTLFLKIRTAMDISSLYESAQTVLSLDGLLVASVSRQSIVVRDAAALQVNATCTFPYSITSIAFSPSARYLLAYNAADKPLVQVYDCQSSSNAPIASIKPGVEGLASAAWLSDTSICLWSDFSLRFTIWQLAGSTPSSVYIEQPKLTTKAGYALRPTDQRYLALM